VKACATYAGVTVLFNLYVVVDNCAIIYNWGEITAPAIPRGTNKTEGTVPAETVNKLVVSATSPVRVGKVNWTKFLNWLFLK
jgi:hypothetical protein